MIFRYGDKVRSLMGMKGVSGVIVGFGSVTWPSSDNINGDAGIPRAVYLVQIAEGSGYERSACVVLRADRVEEA